MTLSTVSLSPAQLSELLDLGLKNITTNRQAKNGTMMFHDPETGASYGLYTASGYVRRIGSSDRAYQLNQRPATMIRRYMQNGHTYTYTTKSIVLVYDFADQLDIAIKAVKNYRSYCKKTYQK